MYEHISGAHLLQQAKTAQYLAFQKVLLATEYSM